MRDRRSVDDLSIEELEQILRVRKREARLSRLNRYERDGRRRGDVPLPADHEPDIVFDPEHTSGVPRPEQAYTQATRPRKQRTLRDRLLLGIELIAALGIVTVLVFAVQGLQSINQETAAALAEEVNDLPTPLPTPIISAVVLPGGHTPPTSPGGAQPNYEEVPSNLRPLVEQQFAGPVIVPTPGPANALRIRIPAIGVDAPIVQGDGWEQLKKGVGQHLGTADPGQSGNIVLSAHNDIYGEIFRHIDQLQDGDEIFIHTTTQEYIYRVVISDIVSPTEVSVMEPTTYPVTTLISCYPYLVNSERIVVTAELVQ